MQPGLEMRLSLSLCNLSRFSRNPLDNGRPRRTANTLESREDVLLVFGAARNEDFSLNVPPSLFRDLEPLFFPSHDVHAGLVLREVHEDDLEVVGDLFVVLGGSYRTPT